MGATVNIVNWLATTANITGQVPFLIGGTGSLVTQVLDLWRAGVCTTDGAMVSSKGLEWSIFADKMFWGQGGRRTAGWYHWLLACPSIAVDQ